MALIVTHFVSMKLFVYLSTSILYVKVVITTHVLQIIKKRRNDNKQNIMELLQVNFGLRPVSDKFWAIKDMIHLFNYILIKYRSLSISSLLLN
jgi:hypothetical protein